MTGGSHWIKQTPNMSRYIMSFMWSFKRSGINLALQHSSSTREIGTQFQNPGASQNPHCKETLLHRQEMPDKQFLWHNPWLALTQLLVRFGFLARVGLMFRQKKLRSRRTPKMSKLSAWLRSRISSMVEPLRLTEAHAKTQSNLL